MFYLSNKIAIVTGAGSGIGKEIAKAFAKQGADVVIAEYNEETGAQTAEEITADGHRARFIHTDVSDQDAVQAMIAATLKEFKQIDILVNNAGVYLPSKLTEMADADLGHTFEVNVGGVINCSQAVLPHMQERGTGRIVNLSSIAGINGYPQSAAYCASKGAISLLTKNMALDYAEDGIRINAIAPGAIETNMSDNALADEATRKAAIAQIPVGRIGQPEDIAAAAVFLASDEADFVTGEILVVDGGQIAG